MFTNKQESCQMTFSIRAFDFSTPFYIEVPSKYSHSSSSLGMTTELKHIVAIRWNTVPLCLLNEAMPGKVWIHAASIPGQSLASPSSQKFVSPGGKCLCQGVARRTHQ
jgi:hypothetical protein